MKQAAGSPHPLLLVAIGASFWGADALLRTPLLDSLSSAQIVLLEHLLLALFALPYLVLHRNGMKQLRGAEWGLLLLIAWGSSGLATWMFTQAFRYGNPSIVILLQKLQPLFAIGFARVMLGERLPRRFGAVLISALIGAYLLSFGWSAPFGGVSADAWTGSLLAVGAALLWGGGTVFGRRLLTRMTFVELTSARFVFAIPFLFGMLAVQPGKAASFRMISGSHWLDLALLAAFPGLLGILVYYRGLRNVKASHATIAELAFPATALLLNGLFLGQGIGLVQAIGAAIVYGAVAALTYQSSRITVNRSALELEQQAAAG